MTTLWTGGRAREGGAQPGEIIQAARQRAAQLGKPLSAVATLSSACVALGLCQVTPRPNEAAQILARWIQQTETTPAERTTSWEPPLWDDQDTAGWHRLIAKLDHEGIPPGARRWEEHARAAWRLWVDYRSAENRRYPFPNGHRS